METDLTSFLVSHDGGQDTVRIESRDGLGRIVVANAPVTVLGSIIIREKPVLVWKTGDWMDYLDHFLDSSDEVKRIVLDMFAPPEDSTTMREAHTTASRLKMIYPRAAECEFTVIRKLIGIANTNAHEYYGTTSDSYREVVVSFVGERISSGKSALFAFGSKVAHSW